MNCSSSASGMALPSQQVPLNLPPGWRFHPTDEEVLLDYLKPKILGDADLLNRTGIQEINILHYNPSDLFRYFSRSGDKELYFLSPAEYHENSKLRKRKVKEGGSWKPTGDHRPITVKGKKRSLVYYNPDATEFKATEYIYTAPLDATVTGDFVFYKVKREPNKKKAANKKSVKAESACKKTTPNKRARKGESSNCSTVSVLVSASASASAFKDKNSKDMIVNPAYGEGEQSNHMASDIENQYPNVMIAMSTYKKGKSSHQQASDFDNQNLISTSVSNIGATGSPMDSYIGNQNSDKITTVSTCNKGDKGCAEFCDSEDLIPNKITNTLLHNKSIPSCQMASCVENQNLYDVSNVSSHNKDETLDCDFHNQNPIRMTTKLLYDQSDMSYLDTLDFEVQNPSNKMDISASIEGEWSPPTKMPSDFDNQNQYQKTDISCLEDCRSLSMASKVGNAIFQVVQSHSKRADMPNLPESGSSLPPSAPSTPSFTTSEVEMLTSIFPNEGQFEAGPSSLPLGAGSENEGSWYQHLNSLPEMEGNAESSTAGSGYEQPFIRAPSQGIPPTVFEVPPSPVQLLVQPAPSDLAHKLGFLMDIAFPMGDPQWLEQMMASPHSELHPIHSNDSPHINGFGTPSHYKTTDTPSNDNNIQGPLAASNEGDSTIPVREDEHMEELLDCFY